MVTQILFIDFAIGNTYVGNLPEAYRTLVRAVDKREIVAEMLVDSGGELAGRAENGAHGDRADDGCACLSAHWGVLVYDC